jgi:hypothetical protein
MASEAADRVRWTRRCSHARIVGNPSWTGSDGSRAAHLRILAAAGAMLLAFTPTFWPVPLAMLV